MSSSDGSGRNPIDLQSHEHEFALLVTVAELSQGGKPLESVEHDALRRAHDSIEGEMAPLSTLVERLWADASNARRQDARAITTFANRLSLLGTPREPAFDIASPEVASFYANVWPGPDVLQPRIDFGLI